MLHVLAYVNLAEIEEVQQVGYFYNLHNKDYFHYFVSCSRIKALLKKQIATKLYIPMYILSTLDLRSSQARSSKCFAHPKVGVHSAFT